jgi:predicted dehydrogenase
MLNIGIIGCGNIGRTHAASIAKAGNCRVAGCCDIDPAALASFGDAFKVERRTLAYKELLGWSGIDAVTVGLPNHLHAPVTIDALRAGRHVFCEKPISLHMTEAEAMARTSVETGKRLMIGVVNRWSDPINRIKGIVSRGEIGDVYQVNVMFKSFRSIPGLGGWFTDKARAGGGVMIDWGVHFIDLVLYILGGPKVKAVSGKGFGVLARTPKDYRFLDMWAGPPIPGGVCDVEEYASGIIRTDGAFITFEGAWAQNINERAMYVDFLGSRGGIRLDYGAGFTIYGQADDYLFETKPMSKDSDFFVNEFRGFADAVLGGKPSRADISAVLPVQKVLDMFYASSREDREVTA